VFVNDLAVRRAIEDLQKVYDYDHLYSVLVSAFNENVSISNAVRFRPLKPT